MKHSAKIRRRLWAARECARLESVGQGSTEQWMQAHRDLCGECLTRDGLLSRSLVTHALRTARMQLLTEAAQKAAAKPPVLPINNLSPKR